MQVLDFSVCGSILFRCSTKLTKTLGMVSKKCSRSECLANQCHNDCHCWKEISTEKIRQLLLGLTMHEVDSRPMYR